MCWFDISNETPILQVIPNLRIGIYPKQAALILCVLGGDVDQSLDN